MSRKLSVIRAWLVHLYTATGLIAAFAAIRALLAGDAFVFFLWQGAALLIDATDGPLARRWEIARRIPSFSGRKLDDIVDYINYTLIPMIFAYQFKLVTGAGVWVLPVVLIASAYGFCQEDAKTDDGYFTGFPSYWNFVIFYLYLIESPPWISALVLGLFAALVFAPIKYLTWKSPVLRRLTFVLSMVWVVNLAVMMFWFDTIPQWAVFVSLLYPVYHLSASFYLSGSRTQKVKI